MELDDIIFSIIQSDNHLIGPVAHMGKDEAPDMPVPTQLDGDKIRYNMNLLDKMGADAPPQFLGEVVHMSLLHPERRRTMSGGMQALEAIADLAADLATFHNITQSKGFIRPEDLGFPEGLSMEEYFELLSEHCKKKGIDLSNLQQPQQGQGKGQGQGKSQDSDSTPTGMGEGEGEGEEQEGDGPESEQEGQGQGSGKGKQDPNKQSKDGGGGQPPNPADTLMQRLGLGGKNKQSHQKWDTIPVISQQLAQHVFQEALKSRGDLPLGMQRLLQMMSEPPQVKWYERLRKMVGNLIASVKREYSYKKLSRRFGYGFPGVKKLPKAQIWEYLDTSGSMDETEIAIALNEVAAIAKAHGVPIWLIMADADIASIERITGKLSVEKMQVKGGGGTDSRPVFKYLEKEKKRVDLFVGFTDCWNVWPDKKPKYPVIWVTTNKDKSQHCPFGETIVIERRERHRR